MITKTTLKNAAKALGYDLWSDPDGSHYLVDYDGVKLKRWDPEHDSSDSLELSVECELELYYGWDEGPTVAAKCPLLKIYHIQDCSRDKLQATRNAILYAAADIGAHKCQS